MSSTSPTTDFLDFDLSFDPALSNIFPSPPPLPSSGNLFGPPEGNLLSASEQSGILGFLEGFDPWNVDIAHDIPYFDPVTFPKQSPAPPYSNPHLNTAPEPSTSTRPKSNPRHSNSSRAKIHEQQSDSTEPPRRSSRQQKTITPEDTTMSTSPGSKSAKGKPTESSAASRNKQALSTPQKRLNHIMSEQKRRNAIRDGYAQLITLLAPDGAPGIDMPTRGRPKGSSSRGGKSSSKGKSGVLFRAVEYVQWLEEGRDALRDEVARLETAAGIPRS